MSAAFVHPSFGALHTLEANFPSTLRLFESESGVFPFEADQDLFSFKYDHQITRNNNFFARFNYADSFDDGVDFGALQGVSNGLSFDTEDIGVVVSDTHIFSANTINNVKFQFSHREFNAATNDPLGPELILSGVAEFGREFFNPTGYKQKVFQVTNGMTLIRGNHTLKMGADFNGMDVAGFAEVFLGGQFSFGEAIPLGLMMDSLLGDGTAVGLITQLLTPAEFGGLGRPDLAGNVLDPISSVQSFNAGLPLTYFQGFGDPNTDINYYQFALFFQDNWKVHRNFTLNLGIRYDIDWRPETLNVINSTPPFDFRLEALKDNNNFSPRLGFAWDILGDGTTVFRGGYGIYYQNFFQAIAFVSQVLSGQISQVFLPLTGLPGIEATSADVYSGFVETGQVGEAVLSSLGITPGTTPSVILPSANDVVNPYSQHLSLGLERQLARDWAVSFDYILNRGAHLIRSRDINVRQVGENQFSLPALDPRFVQINMLETSASSIYSGFTAALRKRLSQNYSLMLSYTFGKAIDDTTDFITQFQPNNQRDIDSERSLSTFDQRQRFVLSGILQSPYRLGRDSGFVKNVFADWTLSPIFTVNSGRPFNILTGFDLNGDTHEETDRPVIDGAIVGRNTGIGPAFVSTDLRLSRSFHLPREGTRFEFIFEAFNLFNNVNYAGVNNVVGNMVLPKSHMEGSERVSSNQPLGFTSAFDPRQIQFGFRFVF
jgi:hypothetical protein